jgi:hypothetical protein
MNFFNASMIVLEDILVKKNRFVNFPGPLIFFFLAFVLQSVESRLRPAFFASAMKDELAFLYPAPRSMRLVGGVVDIRSLCFPLETAKKYGFLLEHFRVRGRGRGLEVVLQERPSGPSARGRDPGGDAYAIDCGPGRIVLSAGSERGRFYALSTLMQALADHEGAGGMPAFALRDAPALAFRGFLFPGEPGDLPLADGLRRQLLKLALLKFSHFALPAGSLARSGLEALRDLARRTGIELIWTSPDLRDLLPFGPAAAAPLAFPAEAAPESWLDFLLDRHRQGRARGERMAVWSDMLLRRPEWIRKLPQDVLVLNRGLFPESGGAFPDAILPFRKHHIPQALCPVLCDRDRFLPDARAAMARVGAACAAAAAGKLAGVMLASCGPGDCGCLPEGAAMVHFQAGCLLWSGRLPGPWAFGRWALGSDEPGLFRVYSFLGQAEHRLPHSHRRYLFEDPLFAPYSRQGDANEVAAHFRKAALYLKKREIPPGELSGFLEFVRRLYELVAAKVEFSMRLKGMLDEAGAGEELRLRLVGLETKARELKNLYLGLRGARVSAAGQEHSLREFDFLIERFAGLRRDAASAGERQGLLRELGDDAAGAGRDS